MERHKDTGWPGHVGDERILNGRPRDLATPSNGVQYGFREGSSQSTLQQQQQQQPALKCPGTQAGGQGKGREDNILEVDAHPPPELRDGTSMSLEMNGIDPEAQAWTSFVDTIGEQELDLGTRTIWRKHREQIYRFVSAFSYASGFMNLHAAQVGRTVNEHGEHRTLARLIQKLHDCQDFIQHLFGRCRDKDSCSIGVLSPQEFYRSLRDCGVDVSVKEAVLARELFPSENGTCSGFGGIR